LVTLLALASALKIDADEALQEELTRMHSKECITALQTLQKAHGLVPPRAESVYRGRSS
jgi:hypothetical protein